MNQFIQQQGYENISKRQEWGIRFTPFICSLLTIAGLITGSSIIFYTITLLGIIAFLFPAHFPFDLLYNRIISPLFNGGTLPPIPFPRRLACLTAGCFSGIIGTLFLLHYNTAGYILGFMMLALQTVVITTHFCPIAWVLKKK